MIFRCWRWMLDQLEGGVERGARVVMWKRVWVRLRGTRQTSEGERQVRHRDLDGWGGGGGFSWIGGVKVKVNMEEGVHSC